MPNSFEDLERQLREQIEALAKQRADETRKVEEHIAQVNAEAELERKQRIEEFRKKEAARLANEKAQQDALEKERKEVEQRKYEAEQASNAAQKAKEEQESRLEWLRNEISKAEFMEERHRKDLADKKAIAEIRAQQDDICVTEEINVEHPTAPDNNGEAVEGTDGDTPETPTMSQHLKHILRQATRSY